MSMFQTLEAAQTAGYTFTLDAHRHAFLLTDPEGTDAGFAHFTDAGERRSFDETIVNPDLRGTGLSALLAQYAITHESTIGKSVAAPCWFMEKAISRHPESVENGVATGHWNEA